MIDCVFLFIQAVFAGVNTSERALDIISRSVDRLWY